MPLDDDNQKAQPQSVLDREAAAKEKREKASNVDEASVSMTGWYSYFKDDDISLLKTDVVIHPIPLLSISDHYTRSAVRTSRRVIGCLLGEISEGKLHITNSFGLPFEENSKDLSVWFVDHNYLNKMYKMFKKINAREHIVGWYSSSGCIKPNDSIIHELFRKYHRNPVFLVVDVLGKSASIVQTYYSFEQPSHDQRKVFLHTPFSLGTSEAEQVGVEHLLRDTDTNMETTLGIAIADKVAALTTAADKLDEITQYLRNVADGKMPEKSHIMAQLQNLLNELPDKSQPQKLAQGFQKFTNDALFAAYIGFATRAVMMVHDLTLNKKQLKEDSTTATTTSAPAAAASKQ